MHAADTRGGNDSNKKTRADNGISFLARELKKQDENALPKTELKSLKLRLKKKANTNGFTSTYLCNPDPQTPLPQCKKAGTKRRRVLKLRRQPTKETQATTRTFILVKGDQEISREYIKQHHEVKPVLKALRRRIETLKARKKGGLISSSTNATDGDPSSVLHFTKFPNLYLVRSASRDAEGDKKHDVLSTAYTEVTDVRTSTPEVSPDWEVLGTIHKYDTPKKSKPKHKEILPDPHIEKLSDPYKETPISSLPLYDHRVLEKATSGLQIFVNDSTDDEKHEKHLSEKTLSGATPTPSATVHDVKTTSSGLHDVRTTSPGLHDVKTSSRFYDDTTTSSGLHDVKTTSPGLHDVKTTSSGLDDETTSSGLYDDTTRSTELHDVKTTSSGLHDVKTTSSGLHDVKTTSPGLQEVSTTSSGLHDVTSSYTTQEPSSASESNDVTSSNDESSISIEELFNDDDSKSSAKIDRLLSDDKTTDALAKEIANLLTDDHAPASSSENPKASPNDLAIVTDDAPIEQKTSQPVTEVSSISAEAVSSAQKTTPLTVSKATEQCLAKRGLGSTQCSLSMICCSACCPLGEHALLSRVI